MRTTVLPLFSLAARLPPLRRWLRVKRERRLLAARDERMLRDVGLDRGEALREVARPFWDAPPR